MKNLIFFLTVFLIAVGLKKDNLSEYSSPETTSQIVAQNGACTPQMPQMPQMPQLPNMVNMMPSNMNKCMHTPPPPPQMHTHTNATTNATTT